MVIILPFLLGNFQKARAAIAVDATTSNSSAGSASSLTVSNHTASGSNRLMLVGISIHNDGAAGARQVSSVVWNTNENLSLVTGCNANASDDARVWIYKLVAPTATTANVVVTLNGAVASNGRIIAGVTTFTGVDQTTSLGTCAIDQDDGSTLSVNVSSATGELVFDTASCEDCTVLSPGAGQDQRWSLNPGVVWAVAVPTREPQQLPCPGLIPVRAIGSWPRCRSNPPPKIPLTPNPPIGFSIMPIPPMWEVYSRPRTQQLPSPLPARLFDSGFCYMWTPRT